MGLILIMVGILLMTLVYFDVITTIFSTKGSGFYSKRLGYLCYQLNRKFPKSKLTDYFKLYQGPVLLITILLCWYGLNIVGWVLIYIGGNSGVVESTTKQPASLTDMIYFIGTGASTTGFGNYVAVNFPYTMLSNLVAFSSTLLVTASISFILSIVMNTIEKKKLALVIHRHLSNIEKLDATEVDSYLENISNELSTNIIKTSQFYSAFPLLNFYNDEDAGKNLDYQLYLFTSKLLSSGLSGISLNNYTMSIEIFLNESSEFMTYNTLQEKDRLTNSQALLARAMEYLQLRVSTYSIHKLDLKTASFSASR